MRRPPGALIGARIAAAAVALLLLVGLAIDRWPFAFDRRIVVGLRAWGGPAWLPPLAIDVTALGSPPVLTIVVLTAAGALLVAGHRRSAAVAVAACASGGFVVTLVKRAIERPRPTLVPHLVQVAHSSFPSGHSTDSAVVYLTLATIAAGMARGVAMRRYLVAVAVLLAGAIGCSRVYLGVHWPSDVMAGWSFGTLWAIGWWRATAKR